MDYPADATFYIRLSRMHPRPEPDDPMLRN